MGTRNLSKKEKLLLLHEAIHDELGDGAFVDLPATQRMMFMCLDVETRMSVHRKLTTLDALGLVDYQKGEGFTVKPPIVPLDGTGDGSLHAAGSVPDLHPVPL